MFEFQFEIEPIKTYSYIHNWSNMFFFTDVDLLMLSFPTKQIFKQKRNLSMRLFCIKHISVSPAFDIWLKSS